MVVACGLSPACGSDDAPAQKVGSGGSPGDAATDADADADSSSDSDASPPVQGTLGAPCTDDSQCGADGSVCLQATEAAWVADGNVADGTGPAGGYCSVDCSAYYDGTSDVDPCAALGGQCYLRWCLEGCSFGTSDAGTKCHGRKDVACSTVAVKSGQSPSPACYPICSPSSDCGPGRVCDPQRSRCIDVSHAHTGEPDGAACSTSSDAGYPGCSQCAATSISVAGVAPDGGDPPRICASRCVYGVGFDCGPMESCLWLPTGHGKGDLGYCAQLCDDATQCHDSVHEVSCDMSYQSSLGHGYCNVIGAAAPSDSGTDAAQDAVSE